MSRLTRPEAIEHRLLDLAYTTSAKITATSLAYFAPCSIEDAERVLDDLASRGRLELEVEEDGLVVYELRGRQQLDTSPAAALVPAIVPAPPSPGLAAALSVFVPGAGHVYTGRIGAAVLWFVAVAVAYGLLLPGLILHVASVVSAARSARLAGISRDSYMLVGPSRPLP